MLSVAPYRSVLTLSGARGLVVAGFVGRLPMAMLGLGSVLLVRWSTGSYGVAGAIAATLALSAAVNGPLLGRLADRHGQARLLVAALAVHTVALIGLTVAALLRAPAVALFPFAALGGATAPPMSSLIRARWSALLPGDGRLHSAFALESVLDEVIFIVGPVLVTALATAWHPAAGVLASLSASLLGGLAFAAQRRTAPTVSPREHRRRASVIRVPGLRALAATFVMLGAVFGTLEVAMVAFAASKGHPVAAGPLLAAFAVGSMLAGVVYGGLDVSWPPHRCFQVGVVVLAAATVPLVAVPSVPVMAAAAVLAGVGVSPTIIAGYALADELVPPAARTEGFTWLVTAVGVGFAPGAALAGWVADHATGAAPFGVTIAAAALAVVVVLVGRLRFVPASVSRPVTSV